MKIYIKYLIALVSLLSIPGIARAVTSQEMEQARTIAAKAYLRYANDGSGYLDDLNPKTMAELEAAIKTKEKENIKAFKAIPVPSDYKDWNKEKLVEYWAVTAFQNKGLLEKGRGGRLRARSQINKMTIAPPQPAAASSEATSTATTSANNNVAAANPNETATDSLASEINAEANQLGATDEDLIRDENDIDQTYNYTWVYIMVLGILVAIVIALVVYAANVMKKNNENAQSHRNDSDDSEELEHLQSKVADKDVEIAMLNKKLEAASRQNTELKSKLDALTAEIATLRNYANKDTSPEKTQRPASPSLKSIFLGRANAKGIFVRADRTLNPGYSVFVLETTDGYSGSFKVADSPAAWGLALSNPREYLETACSGHDLEDTSGVSRIVTESSGTAIFEGGCWRVTRKARIRYA